jgi:hypothetical protein
MGTALICPVSLYVVFEVFPCRLHTYYVQRPLHWMSLFSGSSLSSCGPDHWDCRGFAPLFIFIDVSGKSCTTTVHYSTAKRASHRIASHRAVPILPHRLARSPFAQASSAIRGRGRAAAANSTNWPGVGLGQKQELMTFRQAQRGIHCGRLHTVYSTECIAHTVLDWTEPG